MGFVRDTTYAMYKYDFKEQLTHLFEDGHKIVCREESDGDIVLENNDYADDYSTEIILSADEQKSRGDDKDWHEILRPHIGHELRIKKTENDIFIECREDKDCRGLILLSAKNELRREEAKYWYLRVTFTNDKTKKTHSVCVKIRRPSSPKYQQNVSLLKNSLERVITEWMVLPQDKKGTYELTDIEKIERNAALKEFDVNDPDQFKFAPSL